MGAAHPTRRGGRAVTEQEEVDYHNHFGKKDEINADGYMKYTQGVMQMHPDRRWQMAARVDRYNRKVDRQKSIRRPMTCGQATTVIACVGGALLLLVLSWVFGGGTM